MNTSSFKELHGKKSFFVLGNCWDALSAKAYEQAGYKALGTSSWALSSINGVKDGENIAFDVVLNSAQSILERINIPLSVDMEKGYSRKLTIIVDNVMKLAHIGCSGINIEDSEVQGDLLPAEQLAKIITSIRSALLTGGFPDFVINARTDTYLSSSCINKITDTLTRASIYQDAGADCLFVPGLSNLQEIRKISEEITLPLNVLNLPNIANIAELQAAGVNRFSLGNSVFDETLAYIEQTISKTFNSGEYAVHYNHAPLNMAFK